MKRLFEKKIYKIDTSSKTDKEQREDTNYLCWEWTDISLLILQTSRR